MTVRAAGSKTSGLFYPVAAIFGNGFKTSTQKIANQDINPHNFSCNPEISIIPLHNTKYQILTCNLKGWIHLIFRNMDTHLFYLCIRRRKRLGHSF